MIGGVAMKHINEKMQKEIDILDSLFGIIKVDVNTIKTIEILLRENKDINLMLVYEGECEIDYDNLIDIFTCDNKYYFLVKKY